METIKKIYVSIQFDAEEIEVGELVSENKLIYFKYYPRFVKRGLEISPLKLKLNTDIIQANQIPFDGLFGVFFDSLPDNHIIDEVQDIVNNWKKYADLYDVTKESKNRIQKVIGG
ncbi:MAG: hypothetical protein RIR11_58 [Bacteroidota bacterium]